MKSVLNGWGVKKDIEDGGSEDGNLRCIRWISWRYASDL